MAKAGMSKEALEELRTLVMLPGVAGFEERVRTWLEGAAKGYADVRTDCMGNLIASIGRTGPQIGIAAHMDEVGLLVTKIEENGTLKFRKMGGVDDRALVGRLVKLHTRRGERNGILGLKAPHLTLDKEEGQKTAPWEKLCIDVGARTRKDAERMGVRLLDPVTIAKGFDLLEGGYLCSRALDNRAGCWAALQALRMLATGIPSCRLSVVWTVQEEIGLRGAAVISRTLPLDYVITVDTYTTTDAPGMDGFYEPVLLGKGPVLRVVDTRAIASPSMRTLVERAAKRARIPLQIGVTGGTTDSAVLQEAGMAAAPLGIAMRYTHSPTELIHLVDLWNLSRLLEATVREIAKNV